MRNAFVRLAVGLSAAAILLLARAHAQGFGVYETGDCVMARAGTGLASPCEDGSSIFFNPANMASIGAGLDVNFAHVQLQQRVDLSSQAVAPGVTFASLGVAPGTDFADADLSANKTHLGFHVGASARLAKGLDFGIRYLAKQT